MTLTIFAEITPIVRATGAAATLRVTSRNAADATAAGGLAWRPAILRRPGFTRDLFDGAFSGLLRSGAGEMDLGLEALGASPMAWGRRPCRIWALPAGADPTLTAPLFDGLVDTAAIRDGRITLRLKVNDAWMDAPLLNLAYAGTGAGEGGPELAGVPKPLSIGAPRGVEPLPVTPVKSIFQYDAYGFSAGVLGAFERATAFPASVGDFAGYAALEAALDAGQVPPGFFATAKAEGLIGFGAPPSGVVTLDIAPLANPRTPGQVLKALALLAGADPLSIDQASLDALDAALTALIAPASITISHHQRTQIPARQLLQDIAQSCNAAAGVDWDGMFVAPRVGIGAASLTLRADATARPAVAAVEELEVGPPFWRLKMGAERNYRVHSFDEIAFFADLVDRGDFAAATVYREGNIVRGPAGARWLYTNPTPTAGNAPPAPAFWDLFEDPPSAADVSGLGALATLSSINLALVTDAGALAALNADSLVAIQATAPNPAVNPLWQDTTTSPDQLKRWNGSAWQTIATLVIDLEALPDGTTRFAAAEAGATNGSPNLNPLSDGFSTGKTIVQVTNTGTFRQFNSAPFLLADLGIQPGDRIGLSVSARDTAGATVVARLRFWDSITQTTFLGLGAGLIDKVSSTDPVNLTRVYRTVTVPAGAAAIDIGAQWGGPAATGTLFATAPMLYRGDGTPPWTPPADITGANTAANTNAVGGMSAVVAEQRANQVFTAFDATTSLRETVQQLQQGGGIARRVTNSLAVGSGINNDSFVFSPARSEIPVIRPFGGGKARATPAGTVASIDPHERRIRAINATTSGFTLEAVFAAQQSLPTLQEDTGSAAASPGLKIEKSVTAEAVDDEYTASFTGTVNVAIEVCVEIPPEFGGGGLSCNTTASSVTYALDTRATSGSAWIERITKTFTNNSLSTVATVNSSMAATVDGLGTDAAWRVRVKSTSGNGGSLNSFTKVAYDIPGGASEVTETATPAGVSPITFEVLGGVEETVS